MEDILFSLVCLFVCFSIHFSFCQTALYSNLVKHIWPCTPLLLQFKYEKNRFLVECTTCQGKLLLSEKIMGGNTVVSLGLKIVATSALGSMGKYYIQKRIDRNKVSQLMNSNMNITSQLVVIVLIILLAVVPLLYGWGKL